MARSLTRAVRRMSSWASEIEAAIDEADSVWDDLPNDDVAEHLVMRRPDRG